METQPWYAVVLLGFGTVFVGLICLIFITKLMSAIIGSRSKKEAAAAATAQPDSVQQQEPIADRGAFVAAVSAAIAETVGTSVNGLRILSIKKVN